jgi:hypothetical protein
MLGPKWFESFHQFPKGTQYIYGTTSPENRTQEKVAILN